MVNGPFIHADIPKDAPRAIARSAEARVRMTTKSAIQWYLDQYFNSQGQYNYQLEYTAPFAVHYETGIQAKDDDDPTIINVQLARIWGELRQKLPCIIIADTGFEWVNPGLGGLDPGHRLDADTFSLNSTMLATLQLSILTGAMDETSAGDLADAITYVLGPLTSINRAHWIESENPEDKWQVRLPLTGPGPEGLERRNVGDDTKDSMWSVMLNLEVEFEGHVRVAYKNPLAHYEILPIFAGIPGMNYDQFSQAYLNCPHTISPLVEVTMPTQVPLQQPGKIRVHKVPAQTWFTSTDLQIATVNERGIITPRKLGPFQILLLQKEAGAPGGAKVLQTWDLNVVPR